MLKVFVSGVFALACLGLALCDSALARGSRGGSSGGRGGMMHRHWRSGG